MPQPRVWFRLQGHVNDTKASMTLNQTRAGNLKLGNRMKNAYGMQGKNCPWCARQGTNAVLNEAHVIMACQAVSRLRDYHGISDYVRGSMSTRPTPMGRILRNYLGQDGADSKTILKRGYAIHKLTTSWFKATQ